ncbi:hypothetical protein GF314_11325 [bacterium]|nr:hypothetical protein [bacterium]
MTVEEFRKALTREPAVKVARKEWRRLGRGFDESQAHDTGIAGMLRVGRLDGLLVAVEEATPTHLAVRRLGSQEKARQFVEARLDAYDRLWDG